MPAISLILPLSITRGLAKQRSAGKQTANVYEVQLVVLTLTAKAASVKLTFFILSLLIMV